MKNIIKILILFILLSGCAINKHTTGELIKTKAYCGKLISVNYDGKISIIQTTMLAFQVKGYPDVPEGTFCYIRREPCRVSATKSIKRKLERKYFSWDNSKEYRIKGEIPYGLFNLK